MDEAIRAAVHWAQQDIRLEMPDGPFHLILCRHLVFTYFQEALQRAILERMRARLPAGGVLVTGKQETLPVVGSGLRPWAPRTGIDQKG